MGPVRAGPVRPGGQPGVLTIRAAGDLKIAANLVDHPTPITGLDDPSKAQNSWAFNLVAGAALTSADRGMAVNKGTGTLAINANTVVYTEKAPIRFASGGDTTLTSSPTLSSPYMINKDLRYSLGSFDGSIEGNVGGNLTLTDAAIRRRRVIL